MMNNKALFNSSDNQGYWRTFHNGSGRTQGRGKKIGMKTMVNNEHIATD